MKISNITQRSAAIIALVLAIGGGYAAAQSKGAAPQGKSAAAPSKAAAPQSAKKHEMSCPMQEAAPLADFSAENTADGAVIRLKAKKPGDVQRIQELAAKMAEHMAGGCQEHDDCMMHGGTEHGGDMGHGGMEHGGDMGHGGMEHGGGMDHGKHESSPKAAPPAAAPHAH